MLFSVVIAHVAPGASAPVSFWPAKRRTVPSAPGVGLTRHPQTGAVQQLRFLYGNLLKIQ